MGSLQQKNARRKFAGAQWRQWLFRRQKLYGYWLNPQVNYDLGNDWVVRVAVRFTCVVLFLQKTFTKYSGKIQINGFDECWILENIFKYWDPLSSKPLIYAFVKILCKCFVQIALFSLYWLYHIPFSLFLP